MTPEQIRRAIAAHGGLRSVNLTGLTVPTTIVDMVPESLARENVLIPIAEVNGVLQIAMGDPSDFEIITKVQFILGRAIQPMLAPAEQIVAAIDRHYGSSETEWVST